MTACCNCERGGHDFCYGDCDCDCASERNMLGSALDIVYAQQGLFRGVQPGACDDCLYHGIGPHRHSTPYGTAAIAGSNCPCLCHSTDRTTP
jgi:hypothetical protein